MAKPSIFSRDYEKLMKKRKRKKYFFVILIIMSVLLIGVLFEQNINFVQNIIK